MGQVNVSINDRSYSVACGDGEEEHLRELARYLDGHVGELAKSVGQVGDARLLLLAGLLVADEYADALKRVESLTAEVKSLKEVQQNELGREEAVEQKLTSFMSDAAGRIEKMADTLEAS
ncbi:MAG: cell division protein ZapA [Rhodobiaceae bacterium]|nr:cell division protein ZapA [Rhodobiaceae bacterium]